MRIEADESRAGVCLSHQYRGCAVATADIRDFRATPLENLLYSVERGDPFIHQMRCIARTKESFRTPKQRWMMPMPTDAETPAKRGFEFRQAAEHRFSAVAEAGDKSRARFFGKAVTIQRLL
ncbi:hypothetical protein HDG33_007350 [Paraburkholderia sp. Cpub6]|nr:hypothetical protein [Paraburkholderia sp. Cpub6]